MVDDWWFWSIEVHTIVKELLLSFRLFSWALAGLQPPRGPAHPLILSGKEFHSEDALESERSKSVCASSDLASTSQLPSNLGPGCMKIEFNSPYNNKPSLFLAASLTVCHNQKWRDDKHEITSAVQLIWVWHLLQAQHNVNLISNALPTPKDCTYTKDKDCTNTKRHSDSLDIIFLPKESNSNFEDSVKPSWIVYRIILDSCSCALDNYSSFSLLIFFVECIFMFSLLLLDADAWRCFSWVLM